MLMREEIGNIKQTDLKEILVGSKITEIKQAMQRGEWHSACSWCKETEDTAGNSGRTVRQCSQETLEKIANDIDYFEPEHLVVNWSNLCNLSCVYCNADTSTVWQSVKKIPINFVRNDQQSLLEIMREKGHSLQGLTLGGGEPLLQKGLLDMLRTLTPEQVNVLLTTNLSVELETNEIYQELKTWPNVSWMVSFDNVDPAKFEYVRDRASWQQLRKNIDTLKRDNQHVWAHPAYSIYNAFDLVEYYEFCDELSLDLYWCELTNPWDLDTRRMPLALRQKAVDEIDQVVARWGSKQNLATHTLENYRKQLLNNSYVLNIDTYTPDVLGWHNNIEQELKKTTRFVDLWPELAKEIKNG
jgi:MoaA/NifB/PqqE/SkfB family radical SAM enzyme